MFFTATPSALRGLVMVFLAVALGLGHFDNASKALGAEENNAPDGLFLTVPSPINDVAIGQIKAKIDDAIVRRNRKITTIVFDFNVQGQPNGTANFDSCNALAQFILDLKLQANPRYPQITTWALVTNEVTRHSVLPVLACNQIALSEDARIGDVMRDMPGGLKEYMRVLYRKIAESRPNFSPDLVERMLDKSTQFKRVSYLEKGVPTEKLVTLENYRALVETLGLKEVKELDLPAGLQPGSAMFDADLGAKVGLCSIKNSRLDLAKSLNLPRKSLTEDWLVGRTPVPWRIELRGTLDKGKLESFERRVRSAVGKGANFLILQLEADGGDTTHIASTAQFLRTLKDDNDVPIKTVAFIPKGQTLGAATFLALGCGEIIMGPDAVLADFSYLKDEELPTVGKMLLPLAREQGYPELLFKAALDKNLVLYRVRSQAAFAEPQLIAEEEFRKDEKSKTPRWVNIGRLDRPAGTLQKITTILAVAPDIRVALPLDPLPEDFNQVYAYYGLESPRIRVSRDDWLDQVAEFFRSPIVNFLLIMFGIIGLIMELKMPGTTVPGVIAALCFVLFFWAYSFVGEFTLLAVLLFVLGLILIGVEIFVVPGFGFPGIAGLLLLLSSLALVTLDRMPQTSQEWVNLGGTFATFGMSLVAAMAGVFLLAWYLPSIPYANRLVLNPPADDNEGYDTTGRTPANAALLGAIGVAATPLRPAGKAQFGDDFLDVIAEGDYVKPGSRVQVIEMEGNRIVVKET